MIKNISLLTTIRRLCLYSALIFLVANGFGFLEDLERQNTNLVLASQVHESNYSRQIQYIDNLRVIENQVKTASKVEVSIEELNKQLELIREKIYSGDLATVEQEIVNLEDVLGLEITAQYQNLKSQKEEALKTAEANAKEANNQKSRATVLASELSTESTARKEAEKLAEQLIKEIEELKKLHEQDLKDMEKFTKVLEKDTYGSYERKQVSADGTIYWVDIVTINLNNPNLRIITDTATSDQCVTNCPTKSVQSYVSDNGGFAGVSGSYFCPEDYDSCQATPGYFPHTIYSSRIAKYFNGGSGSSMIAFDKNRGVHFIDYSVMPVSKSELDKKIGADVIAAIANVPLLTKGGSLAYNNNGYSLDYKQRAIQTRRSAIGKSGDNLKIVITRSATTPEMAKLMLSLGINDSLELDGGGSTSLIYNSDYKVGPGRAMPTAIIFAQ